VTTPETKAGRWLVAKSNWDAGMRGFFVRINLTAGPEDMLVHVLAIEAEARADLLDPTALEQAMVAVLGDGEVSTVDGSVSVRQAAAMVRVALIEEARQRS
jgi:hypothetical protein